MQGKVSKGCSQGDCLRLGGDGWNGHRLFFVSVSYKLKLHFRAMVTS